MSWPKGLAAGCSGLRAEHVKAVLSDRNAGNAAEALDLITKFTNLCIAGYLPHELQEFFCGGRLIPLNKKDQGLRPVVVGEFFRSLVSKLALKEVQGQLLALQPAQIGVSGKGPVIQAAILCVKSWVREMHPDELLLKVDISNAYNSINRNACLEGVKKHCPELMRWARWCLDGCSRVYYGTTVIPCSTGVQQRDPMAPALFAVGLHHVIAKLQATPEIHQMWFLDDGIFRGKTDQVLGALKVLQNGLSEIDLQINAHKCELYLPTDIEGLRGFGTIPIIRDRDAWSYLGTPLSEQTPKALDSVRARVTQATAKILAFAKTYPFQAFHLLRATAGACKIEYLMQTCTRSAITDDLVATCSTQMRAAYASILREHEVDDLQWTHATLPQRKGGYGLRDQRSVVDTARLYQTRDRQGNDKLPARAEGRLHSRSRAL